MKTALELIVLCSNRRQNRGGRTAESASPWCFLALAPRLTHGRAGTCEDTMIDPILSHLRLSGRTTLECRAPESHTAAPDVCQRHKARHGLARIARHLDHHQLLVVTREYWPSSGSTREPYKDGVFPECSRGTFSQFRGDTCWSPSLSTVCFLHFNGWSVEDPFWGWNSLSGRPEWAHVSALHWAPCVFALKRMKCGGPLLRVELSVRSTRVHGHILLVPSPEPRVQHPWRGRVAYLILFSDTHSSSESKAWLLCVSSG